MKKCIQHSILIATEDDFIKFLEKIDDEEYIKTTAVTAKQVSVSFKIQGDNFESSLTGSLITALAEYQEKVYRIYKIQKYGQNSTKSLTPEEKRALEIKVYIKPGCTEAVISFVKDIIPEVTKQMTGAEISRTAIAIAGIVAGAWAIKSIAVPLIKEKFKSKRNEIEAKIKTSNNELEKQYLTTMQTITQTAIDGMRCVAQGLSIADPATIAIDGQPVPKENIANIPREMAPTKEKEKPQLPDFYTVDGQFKVLDINYEKPVTLMKAIHIESNTVYDDISLQDDWMKPESMAILENAQSREPVYFRISCQKSGRRYMHFIDVNSIQSITDK